MPRPTLAALTTTLLALTLLTACTHQPTTTPVTGNPDLTALTIAPNGPMTGYSRDQFGDGWTTQADHCTSRVDVLKTEDQTTPPTGCTITTGQWLSLYDGTTITTAHNLDIDHLVPLANAWITGARTWTPTQRRTFANDTTTELIAVSAHSNRSKGDQPPPTYEPPNPAEHCSYAQRWITIKTKYHLTITQPEHDALADMLATCTH